jgi:multidrug efflux pump subunit AcrA (membrane-fusion protein)
MPDRYQVWSVLEPIRRVTLVAAADGVIRSLDARPGGVVRESQELAQLDRTEANAKLKIASAEMKEKQALLKSNKTYEVIYQAQLEAAQARAELAQIELDRCTLRAPFAGMVLAVPISIGQYVLKGATIVELADVTSLRAVLPVDRRTVAAGSALVVQVEDQDVSGKVQAVLPLSDGYATLRELATPFACASVLFPNSRGDLEPGLRARPAGVPISPIATVPKRALRPDEVRGAGNAMVVQVIRNEYVVNVPVLTLGSMGPERAQVSGLLRSTDALIVASSVALVPGTLVRFGDDGSHRGIEGTAPNPSIGGSDAGIIPPGADAYQPRTNTAPAAPGRSPRRTSPTARPPNPPAQSSGGDATPF